MLGNNQSANRTYLSVGFGKIRQKHFDGKSVTSETPNAKLRKTQSGAESWALEYDFLEGKIENVFYKEDKEYGSSFEVVISDAVDEYQLSFKEDSRFWVDFACKLPNIKLSEKVKITAYDFEDKTSKRRVGISVEQGGEKITNFYSVKTDAGWRNLHGFPESGGVNWQDQDDIKVYMIAVKKFLRTEYNSRISDMFTGKAPVEEAVSSSPITEAPDDDLPF